MIQKKLIGKIWIFEDFVFCGLIDFRQLNERKLIETNEMLQEVWFFLLNYHFQSINGDECAKIKKCKQSRIPIIRRIKKAIKIRKFYIKTKFNRTNDSLFSFWIIYFLPNFLTFDCIHSMNVLWICSFRQRNWFTKDHIICRHNQWIEKKMCKYPNCIYSI